MMDQQGPLSKKSSSQSLSHHGLQMRKKKSSLLKKHSNNVEVEQVRYASELRKVSSRLRAKPVMMPCKHNNKNGSHR